MLLLAATMRTDGATHRGGFTLLELVVALAFAATVFLGARMLLDALSASRDELARETALNDERANGERLLRSLVAHAEAGDDSTSGFQGDQATARFSSWCATPASWLERCRVRLAVHRKGAESIITASVRLGETIRVWRQVGTVELRYLDRLARDTSWTTTWESRIAVPTAIGVVSGGDTVVLVVGGGRT